MPMPLSTHGLDCMDAKVELDQPTVFCIAARRTSLPLQSTVQYQKAPCVCRAAHSQGLPLEPQRHDEKAQTN